MFWLTHFFLQMKDVSEIGQDLSVNIEWPQDSHSINVVGKGIKFLKDVKSLHQMIERKVAEREHSASRHRNLSGMCWDCLIF